MSFFASHCRKSIIKFKKPHIWSLQHSSMDYALLNIDTILANLPRNSISSHLYIQDLKNMLS